MNSARSRIVILFTVVFLFFSGCAKKQWQDPLGEEEEKGIRTMLLREQLNNKACSCCIDAEVTAVWNSQLYDGGITGYLQIFMPSSFKLVAINPLGQPLFAISTNGKRFQTINAVKGVYKHGKLASFVERHSLPLGLLEGEWPAWLAGRLQFNEDEIKEVRQDISSRGVWLLIEKKSGEISNKEYVLFDTTTRRILERVPMSTKGDELARIEYSTWSTVDNCPIPTEFTIHGSSFGTDVIVELRDIVSDQEFNKEDFYLKLPPGYLQQYYP